MIKGIYNENEFYTNFYWDTKLLEDMRSKAPAGAEEKVNQLKALDSLFWKLKESTGSHGANKGQQIEFYNLLFRILGFQAVQESTQTTEGAHYTRFLNENKDSNPELIGILTSEIETGSFETFPLNLIEKIESEESSFELDLKELLREELLDSQAPPRWVLVGSPNSLFIIERTKWALGRYIRIEWQEVFLQRDSKPYELLLGLCSKSALCPDSGSSNHDEFDDNSHRHAFEVTTELRESVREAIEALINELIDLRKESHQKIYAKESSDIYAKELTHDALYYVYRLLFLLYLEAQGEDSDLLPLKSEIYRNGYSLEKLLELDFIEVAPDSPESKGTFIFESLEQIFNLIFYGFEPGVKDGLLKSDLSATGFLVKGIKSDLFDPNGMKHLKGVKLSNGVLLDILKKLSLTRKKERGNKPRARVSYANLGINQLGAVYEGLLSYTGFFAQEDLHALKPANVKQSDIDKGKELDQVYLAPKSLVEKYRRTREEKFKISDQNTVLDIDGNPKVYKKGSFIYRLAGRDRQKLASYYTPESLTKCTVKYSLKVLFETKKSLEDLWKVKILEPAMGSGAFLNEAVNQLADKILELEIQQRLYDLSSPKAKKKRLWEVKYQLISQNVYGVDLNPTAIELARFSLWLNCIGAGKEPPQFTGRLKVGNSLIGARFKKGADGIYPWLLLDDGMMNYGKRLKEYDADQYEKLQHFRKELIGSKLESSSGKIKDLQLKAERVFNDLLTIKEQKEKETCYEKLKLCGDLWCSAFFLQGEDLKHFPANHDDLCNVFDSILETGSIDSKLKNITLAKYNSERFFHWDIEFPEIIVAGGFDLILGNPPWLAIEWKDSLFVSDINPIPVALEFNAADTRAFVESQDQDETKALLAKEFVKLAGYSLLLEVNFYNKIRSVSKNTYKAFDVVAFSLLEINGVFGVIQEDGILEDKQAEDFRRELYLKFKFHFQFQNERFLFSEVGHAKRLSVNIFIGKTSKEVSFHHIGNLFIPTTIDTSFGDQNGADEIPLIKNEQSQWETRGHSARIIHINDHTIDVFRKFNSDTEETTPVFLNAHSKPMIDVISKLAEAQNTIVSYLGSDNVVGSEIFNQTGAQDKGYIFEESKKAGDIKRVILSGPHINTLNPLSQETQVQYKSKFSYDTIDLTTINSAFYPRTLYQLKISEMEVDAILPKLKNKPYRSFYRVVTRNMVNPTNERCLFSCIIPPGVMHINTLNSFCTPSSSKLSVVAGFASSLVLDGYLRLKNKTHVFTEDLLNLPIGSDNRYFQSLARRTLVLNALTEYYDELIRSSSDLSKQDNLITGNKLEGFGEKFDKYFPLRSIEDREQAMIEIDALVAISFGLSAIQLTQVYEILFPVLSMYDRKRGFNRKAKLIEAHKFFQERGW